MLRLMRFLANFHYGRGRTEKALTLYRWICRNGGGPRDRMSLGRLLLKTGHFDEAETELKKISRSDLRPIEVVQVRLNLALALWKKGQLDEAVTRMEAVYAENKITLVYACLGYLLVEQGDLHKALAFNQEAYAYNPKNSEIRDNLGQCLLELGETGNALEIYQALAKDKHPPTFPEWRYHYALALEAAGRRDEALDQLKLATVSRFSSLSSIRPEKIQAEIARLKADGMA